MPDFFHPISLNRSYLRAQEELAVHIWRRDTPRSGDGSKKNSDRKKKSDEKQMLKKISKKMLKKNLRKNWNFRFSKNQDFRISNFSKCLFFFEILKFLKFQNFQNQKSPRLKNNFRSDFFYSWDIHLYYPKNAFRYNLWTRACIWAIRDNHRYTKNQLKSRFSSNNTSDWRKTLILADFWYIDDCIASPRYMSRTMNYI